MTAGHLPSIILVLQLALKTPTPGVLNQEQASEAPTLCVQAPFHTSPAHATLLQRPLQE